MLTPPRPTILARKMGAEHQFGPEVACSPDENTSVRYCVIKAYYKGQQNGLWSTLFKESKRPKAGRLTDLVLAEAHGKAGLCCVVVLGDEISLAFPLQHHGMKVWSPSHALFLEGSTKV